MADAEPARGAAAKTNPLFLEKRAAASASAPEAAVAPAAARLERSLPRRPMPGPLLRQSGRGGVSPSRLSAVTSRSLDFVVHSRALCARFRIEPRCNVTIHARRAAPRAARTETLRPNRRRFFSAALRRPPSPDRRDASPIGECVGARAVAGRDRTRARVDWKGDWPMQTDTDGALALPAAAAARTGRNASSGRDASARNHVDRETPRGKRQTLPSGF